MAGSVYCCFLSTSEAGVWTSDHTARNSNTPRATQTILRVLLSSMIGCVLEKTLEGESSLFLLYSRCSPDPYRRNDLSSRSMILGRSLRQLCYSARVPVQRRGLVACCNCCCCFSYICYMYMYLPDGEKNPGKNLPRPRCSFELNHQGNTSSLSSARLFSGDGIRGQRNQFDAAAVVS